MRDYNLSARVLRARHALAIDDERNAFHPQLWNEQPDPQDASVGVPGGNLTTQGIDDERISQVWFAGVHSNVGGGYPDDSLSYVPLQWVMSEAHKYGLRFTKRIWDAQIAVSDENGPVYDSRQGLGGYYRYNPRRIERLTHTAKVSIGRTKVHESVLRRIQVGHDGYAPITLPAGFAVMTIDGRIVDGDRYLRDMPPATRALAGTVASATPAAVDAASLIPLPMPLVGAASLYAEQREHVYNWVWRRRVAYFATLAVTLALALMPLVAPGTGACVGVLCFLASPIAALGLLLPSFATAWTDSFSEHPDVFLPLLLALIVGLWRGGSLEQRVHDEIRRIWYGMPILKPSSAAGVRAPRAPNAMERAIERMRGYRAYRAMFRLLTHRVVPADFLVAIVYGAVALCSQVGFAARASIGGVCRADGSARVLAAGTRSESPFDPSSTCVSTGVRTVEGETYRVRIVVPAMTRWSDHSIPAGPNGFECPLPPSMALRMAAAVPLRRHLTEPWFQPMARIGPTGNDAYALHGTPRTGPPRDRCIPNPPPPAAQGCPTGALPAGPADEVFESLIVARSSEVLFLYVNDAVGPPFANGLLYANNRGCGRVEVSTVVPASR